MPAKKTTPKSASKAKKVKTTSAPVEVAAPAVTPSPVEVSASATPEVSTWTEIETQFSSLNTRLQEFKSFYASLTSDIRKLQKNVHKHLKETAKKNKRRRKNNTDPNKR